MVFKARAVCSIVTSGFFPPQPIGLLGGEQQNQLAEGHVSHQPLIAAPLEVSEADLGLCQTKHVLDPRPSEGDFHQCQQGRFGRGVGDEILDLAGGDVPGDDQPIGPLGGRAIAGQIDLAGPDLPHLRGQRFAVQFDLLPRLALKWLAKGAGVVDPLGREGSLLGFVPGQSAICCGRQHRREYELPCSDRGPDPNCLWAETGRGPAGP